MWLLFPFSRRFRLYDHTVFVTYSLCFMTLLVVAGLLSARLACSGRGLRGFIPPFHMYRQLKGAYGLGPLTPCGGPRAVIFAFIGGGLVHHAVVGLGLFD